MVQPISISYTLQGWSAKVSIQNQSFILLFFQCTIFEVICIVCYAWFAISFILSFILLLEIFIIFFLRLYIFE